MKFADIAGLDAVKSKLIKTVVDHRVSHAQLFLGPEGSGKLALALAYAQYINCTDKQENDSCGKCASCVKYDKLIHPDLHFIYPTARTKSFDKPISKNFISDWRSLVLETKGIFNLSQWYEQIQVEKKQAIINVRDCNEIITTLSYKSYEAEYKVMIIWMVEKLFHAAAPKILKILEEPPDKTLFILISENQEQIINTILSRTQLVKIPYFDKEDIRQMLTYEGHQPGVVNEAVNISGGNYIAARKVVGQSDEPEMGFSWFSEWMRICYKGQFQSMIDFGSEFSKQTRETQKSLLKYALRMIRESVMINIGEDKLAHLSKNEKEFVAKFHPFINQRNVQMLHTTLNDSIFHIERNANPGILFLDMSIKFARLIKM
ncbi:MAG: DNA polymerase III subunit delta [Bacteroidales bacterium]|nr:DNA polymerase III subunit delta [Bacteroidales bacterium]MCF8404879.1 DNA polymerase III subunit delta [Bacteroidales bacterium]